MSTWLACRHSAEQIHIAKYQKTVLGSRNGNVQHAVLAVDEFAIGMFGVDRREDHHRPLSALKGVNSADSHLSIAFAGLDAKCCAGLNDRLRLCTKWCDYSENFPQLLLVALCQFGFIRFNPRSNRLCL
ncbi:hypothetical protein D3C78_1303120 [compost metagenome]